MKIQFKHQQYQTNAVEAVIDCFAGQPKANNLSYRIDPGVTPDYDKGNLSLKGLGIKNNGIELNKEQILKNIQAVQRRQNLTQSQSLNTFKTSNNKNALVENTKYSQKALDIASYHLDIEMETGTGKTYCYIKTIFELNKQYGWSKFIIVVPSIAIREGVYKTLQMTADHFQPDYGNKAKFFIYNSKQLQNLEAFSSDSGINIMVINVQAFNAKGKDNRRIYEALDSFQSRRPIDVIKANRPILILDEPQKMEGERTLQSLKEFEALFVLRYSATHKSQHHKIHRLDALDAYNQKLVKKIAVRGITVKGLAGTHGYLYLESIQISKQAPTARIEIEIKQNTRIKRIVRKCKKGDNLYDLSNGLAQYQGFVISDINAINDTVELTNGVVLNAGEAVGDVNELTLRRIQIREAINAHLEKEQQLFKQGIKVLSLFFIDEVAKYRSYGDDGEQNGAYAQIFEEEYQSAIDAILNQLPFDKDYQQYLRKHNKQQVHNGYFAIDKKSKHMVDPAIEKKTNEAKDAIAYDLILKDKERLLSFAEPTRFLFSHSALREGWDNPNVFVICTLKHSDNTISRRQEVGRGLRIAVNQYGERQDNPATVHDTNVLTVVANESYSDFVTALQQDISDTLSERPRTANIDYFKDKVLQTATGGTEVTEDMANKIYRYLIKNDYTDDSDHITDDYHNDLKNEKLADLPEDLQPYKAPIIELINSIFSDANLPQITNDRRSAVNQLNDNFNKKEFQALWQKINHKAIYTVNFESEQLVNNCVSKLNAQLKVTPLIYQVEWGSQKQEVSSEQITKGDGFELTKSKTEKNKYSVHSAVKYDLIGTIAANTQLTRKTICQILTQINKSKFDLFKANPEGFIAEASRLIKEQKATAVVERLSYNTLNQSFESSIFTASKEDLSKASIEVNKHIYDFVVTDSKTESSFVQDLDKAVEVVVYAKLPKGFAIPTPVGDYNPDWAIAFEEGQVKHIYFVAETKGSLSSLDLRGIEDAKIQCARKFFDKLNACDGNNAKVKYDVVNSFDKLKTLVS